MFKNYWSKFLPTWCRWKFSAAYSEYCNFCSLFSMLMLRSIVCKKWKSAQKKKKLSGNSQKQHTHPPLICSNFHGSSNYWQLARFLSIKFTKLPTSLHQTITITAHN